MTQREKKAIDIAKTYFGAIIEEYERDYLGRLWDDGEYLESDYCKAVLHAMAWQADNSANDYVLFTRGESTYSKEVDAIFKSGMEKV